MNFKPLLPVLLISLVAFNPVGAGTSAGDVPSASDEQEVNKQKETKLDESERAKQKALLGLLAAAAVGGATQYLQNNAYFAGLGTLSNLKAGEFSAACGLSAIFSALGIIARDDLAKSFNSIAWRIPVMTLVGGAVTHPRINELLSKAPFMGDWFKKNPVEDKKGIIAIYTIGGWYLIKPSLDRIENYVSKKISKASSYLSGDKNAQA